MNKIKELREKAGISQPALSKLTGINIRQVQRYESGDYNINNMTLKNAVALAKMLNVRTEDLLEDE